jgi:predicted AlkP superfamily pyrophosphatase or phosphodiesterase
VVVAALVLWACGGSSPAAPTAQPPPTAPTPAPARILVMSVDGLRPDALPMADAQNVLALAARGSYTWQAQTISPSNTLPSHTSMLTGVTPALHKITWDDYLPANGKLTVPTLFTALKAVGDTTAMVVGKEKFMTINDAGGVDAYVLSARGDDDVANQAIVQIVAGYSLVFVHFPDVDLTGHARAWLSADYMARVKSVDTAIGRVLASVPANMTVIVTADHGGSDFGHGTTAAVHMTIPWIISGPRIKPANLLSVKVNTTDTAVTSAFLLGAKISDSVSGRVVVEALQY